MSNKLIIIFNLLEKINILKPYPDLLKSQYAILQRLTLEMN